jgi:hypothetical protein
MPVKPSEAKKMVDQIMSSKREHETVERKHLDAIAILSLPANLRKTAMAIHKKGKATAEMIAGITDREKTVELECLNQLVEMGYLETKQEADNIYFII